MTRDILVSVIVPVYNVEQYVSRCIESIVNQTYKNIEIILVNDGSKDNSGKICDEYAKKDSRIKVIHKENGGVSDARNLGIDNSNAEIIYFVDSDDYIHKDLIKDNLDILIKNNADMVCFNRYIVDGDKVLKRINLYNESMATYDVIEGIWKKRLSNSVCDKLYQKSLWNSLKFKKGTVFEDLYATSNILANVQKIICNNKAYYYYNVDNNSSIMHTVGIRRYYLEFVGACIKLNIAKDKKWVDLYDYTIKAAYEYGFKAYQYNVFIKYLSADETEEIKKFFRGGQGSGFLSIKNKIFLWDFLHGKLINRLKGLFYYIKAKQKGWI